MRQREVEPNEDDVKIAERIVRFVNAAWGRSLRSSRSLERAVAEAREAGYGYDQMRLAYWSAACGNDYAMDQMSKQKGRSAELFLRFKGGFNTTYGTEAKKWLDELYEVLGDVNPGLVLATLERIGKVDADYAREEAELLRAHGVSWPVKAGAV